MKNLHESFGEANFDFEIEYFQAKMTQSRVSFKVGSNFEYEELTVPQLIDQKYTVMVNALHLRFEILHLRYDIQLRYPNLKNQIYRASLSFEGGDFIGQSMLIYTYEIIIIKLKYN